MGDSDSRGPKLENYLIYGMTFGLLGGSLLSPIGIMLGNVLLAVGSLGLGIAIGMLVGFMLYSFEKKKPSTE
ncbi:hypothetical protein QMK38_07620 [Lysinibacillus fusiformis]|nr:hypothetical protein [Lysinibacillus fusiformis]